MAPLWFGWCIYYNLQKANKPSLILQMLVSSNGSHNSRTVESTLEMTSITYINKYWIQTTADTSCYNLRIASLIHDKTVCFLQKNLFAITQNPYLRNLSMLCVIFVVYTNVTEVCVCF